MSRLPRPVRIALLALGLLGLALLAPRPSSPPVPARAKASLAPPLPELPTADVPAWPPQAPPRKAPRPPPAPNPLAKMARGITAAAAGGPAAFVMRDEHASAFFGSEGVTLILAGPAAGGAATERRGYALRWGLIGATESSPRGEGERSEKVRRYVGDRSRWSEEQISYDAVVYENVRPGVDMTVESRPQALKYTLHAVPGADLSDLRFRYAGAHDIRIAEDGQAVEIVTEIGTLTETGLAVWQDGPGGRREVEARYVPAGAGEVAIALGEHDPSLAVTVDPVIGWSSFLGGSLSRIGDEQGFAVAADADGNVYVAGYTTAVDLPAGTTAGFDTSLGGTLDGFLVKINASGIVWSTYLGGSGFEQALAVALDPSGNPIVTGYTSSADFPTTPGAYDTLNNSYDAFVAKFTANGSLVWSTFLGGSSTDYGQALAVDGSGNVYVGGFTYSSNFPIVSGFDGTIGATPDGYVAKLSADGASLMWSSYLGGNDADYVQGLALDGSNNVYVVGYTYSSDFPTTGGLDTTLGGTVDAFLTKISAAGSSLLWSTYLGGSNSDYAFGVTVTNDLTPEPVVVGYTYSTDFPVAAAYDPTHNGGSIDAFVTRVLLTAGNPVGYRFSTFLGGTSTDYAYAVAPGPSGSVYVAGNTFSGGFPTTAGAYRTALVGLSDAYVAQFSALGGLTASTYVGGTSYDYGRAVAVVSSGGGAGVYVAGYTQSTDFSLPLAPTRPDGTLGGTQDAFVARLALNLASASWTSYVGGADSLGDDWGYDVVVDPSDPAVYPDYAGDVIVVGYTNSWDHPASLGPLDATLNGTTDAYVTRIDVGGSAPVIQWSTYLGGNNSDYAFGAAVDRLGFPYAVGYTLSTDFPVKSVSPSSPVFDGTIVGAEAFVTCLNPNGTLYYSTAIGGSSSDYGRAIAVDTNFNAYVTGYTYSTNFPMLNAFDSTPATTPDVFVVKLNVNGSGVYSSYLGGNDYDQPNGIACDNAGTFCVVTGYTYSTDFPSSVTFGGGTIDAFVTRISGSSIPSMTWSRYLGGAGSDQGHAVALSADGTRLYAVGQTGSSNFPTASAFDATLNGTDGYVSRLDPANGSIVWSTFLGGTSTDYALAAKADASGNVYVTGYTFSGNFPVKGAFDSTFNGGADAYVTKFYASGTLAWSSYLGGSLTDHGYGIAIDAAGTVYVTGITYSPDFPSLLPLDGTLGGNHDAFVVALPNGPPDLPDFSIAGTGQFRLDGTTALPVGAWTNEDSIVVKARVSDSDDDNVRLEVEIRLRTVNFDDGSVPLASGYVASGSIAQLTVGLSGLPPSQYHWRVRTRDAGGRPSGWLYFGGNSDILPADRDVGRDTAAPTVNITSPSSTGTFYTQSSSVAIAGSSADLSAGVASVAWINTTTSASGSASGTTSWSVGSIALQAGSNVIEVRSTDAAGNVGVGTITVYRDNTAPSVAIGSPAADPFVTGTGSVAMSGTCSDNLSLASVTWSNDRGGSGAAAVVGTSWSATVSGLSPGLNVITVRAQDSAGNSSTDTHTINYDTLPPMVAVGSPAHGTTTDLSSVTLTGTASDNVLVSGVSWKNATTSQTGGAAGTTSWTASNIPLVGGANVLEVTATDSVGLASTTSITVYHDIADPSIQITLPTTDPTFTTGSNSITLGGTASDDIGVQSVSWTRDTGPGSGSGVLANPGAASSSWSAGPIALQSGANVITVTITDKVGRTSSDVITVTLDTNGPSVVVVDPPTTPFATGAASIVVSGTAADNVNVESMACTNLTTGVSPTVTTDPLPALSTDWSVTVALNPGSNVIEIRASDAGLTTTVTITVIRDDQPPSVKITGPTTADDYYTGIDVLALSGTVTDNGVLATLGWSTTAAVVPASGSIPLGSPWSVASIPLAVGAQTISVTATDEGGNVGTDTLVVIYDPTLPDITITAPSVADSTVVTSSAIVLGGTASDNTALGSVTWSNAATAAGGPATGTTNWSVATINLLAGANPITVVATDRAGNIKTDTILVHYDTQVPQVAVTGPSSGATFATNAATVSLEGTASDDIGVQSVSWTNAATGAAGTAAGTTAWSEPAVGLNAGDNVITVTVTDVAGKTSTDVITIHYDPNAPALAVTTPAGAGPHSTTGTPYALAGTTSDLRGDGSAGTVVRVDWVNLTTGGVGSVVPAAGSWAANVPLTSGLNSIELTAFDEAGNTALALVDVTYDPAAPLVTISVPTTDLTFTTGTTPILMGGTASDDVGVVSVSWSTAAAVSPTSGAATGTNDWTASVPLAPGSNLITITAADGVGRTGTSRITIVYDPTPPSIAITSPTAEAAFLTTLSPLSIGGAASDNLEVQSVTWENTSTGENGVASGTGAWSVSAITLVEGLNVITAKATDGVGNVGTATITVNYDGTPPTVFIVTPPPPTFDTSVRPLAISGTAGDNLNLASVTWTNSLGGGGSANLAGTATSADWDASVYLFPGANVITVTATDAHGYTATDVLTVDFTPESVAPGIQITGPSSGGSAVSATQLAALSGTADDNVGIVEVRWINQSTGVRGTAILSGGPNPVNWDADVPLASGVNVIVVTAVDDAGNATSATIAIEYTSPSDAVLPAVTITGPTLLDLWDATASPLGLVVTASDNVGIAAVTWSNAATGGDGVATLVGGTTWSADVALAAGANTVTVTARDAAGNTAQDTLIVNFVPAPGDAVAPTVTITSHPTGTTVNVSDVLLDLAGTASDNVAVAGVVWSNAATGTSGGADGSAAWTAGVVLVDGINVITVRVYDTSGNFDTDQITVLYTAPPLPPEVLPSGHCGLIGLEGLLLLGLLALRRRKVLSN